MIEKESLYTLYEYFYQKFYKEENYQLVRTPTVVKLVDGFYSTLQKEKSFHSLGVNFLSNYLSFQENYWKGLTIKSFNGKITFSFIFGPKALQRYKSRDSNFDYQLGLGSFSPTNISQLLRVAKKQDLPYDNPIKIINHNTPKGFSNCIEQTTLYDHRDTACSNCKFNKECKTLLRKKYPNIYKSRGYKL
jgi:hypothetical protein